VHPPDKRTFLFCILSVDIHLSPFIIYHSFIRAMNTSHECTLSFGFDVQNAGGRSHLGAKDKYTHLVYTSSQASYLKELIKSLFYFLFNIL
jgi:hypothetical protein